MAYGSGPWARPQSKPSSGFAWLDDMQFQVAYSALGRRRFMQRRASGLHPSDLLAQADANAGSLALRIAYKRPSFTANGVVGQQRDRCENNECKKDNEEKWDHETVIGKVGRAIKAAVEIDPQRPLWNRRKLSWRQFLSSRLSNQFCRGCRIPSPNPDANPNTDSDRRKRRTRNRLKKNETTQCFVQIPF